jgi:hypothetical protein
MSSDPVCISGLSGDSFAQAEQNATGKSASSTPQEPLVACFVKLYGGSIAV